MTPIMGYTLQILTLLTFTIGSCTDSSTSNKTSINSAQENFTSKSDSIQSLNASTTNFASNDTLIVDKQAAVFIEPDSLQVDKKKKQVGEEVFYIGADDYLFYMNTAHHFLDSMKMSILYVKEKKFIKFIRNDKSQQVIRTDTLNELWSLYLFDPTKKAKQIDITIIDQEYKSYL